MNLDYLVFEIRNQGIVKSRMTNSVFKFKPSIHYHGAMCWKNIVLGSCNKEVACSKAIWFASCGMPMVNLVQLG